MAQAAAAEFPAGTTSGPEMIKAPGANRFAFFGGFSPGVFREDVNHGVYHASDRFRAGRRWVLLVDPPI
jgi:hypothetical protein